MSWFPAAHAFTKFSDVSLELFEVTGELAALHSLCACTGRLLNQKCLIIGDETQTQKRCICLTASFQSSDGGQPWCVFVYHSDVKWTEKGPPQLMSSIIQMEKWSLLSVCCTTVSTLLQQAALHDALHPHFDLLSVCCLKQVGEFYLQFWMQTFPQVVIPFNSDLIIDNLLKATRVLLCCIFWWIRWKELDRMMTLCVAATRCQPGPNSRWSVSKRHKKDSKHKHVNK